MATKRKTSKLDRVIKAFLTDLEKEENKALTELQGSFKEVQKRFERRIQELQLEIEAGSLFDYNQTLARLTELSSQISDDVLLIDNVLANQIKAVQSGAIDISEKWSRSLISATMGPSPTEALGTFNTFNRPAINRLVGTLQSGSPVDSLIGKYAGQYATEASKTILEGIAFGLNPLTIAKTLEKAFNVPFSNAATVMRTEQLRVFRESNRATFEANQDIVKGWQWYAVLDRFTCPVCWAMHGTNFKVSDKMDTHPNCRCVQLPVTKTWKELGFDMPEPTLSSGAVQFSQRGGAGFPSVSISDALTKPGTELFAKLPDNERNFILGKAANKAYNDGLVTLPDFVAETYSPVWGYGRRTKSLSEIVGREKARTLINQTRTVRTRPPALGTPLQTVKPFQTPITPSPIITLPEPPRIQAAFDFDAVPGITPTKLPTPPVAKAVPDWRASMPLDEAELFASQGDLTRPLFHVTSPEGAEGIAKEGFDLTRRKWGRVWGDGAYMSDSAASEAMYSSAFSDPTKIELRVFSRKTLKAQITANEPYEWGYGNIWNGVERDGLATKGEAQAAYNKRYKEIEARFQKRKDDLLRKYQGVRSNEYYAELGNLSAGDVGSEALTTTLQEDYGYDAIDLFEETHTGSVGGSQVIVFDPKRVTVVDRKKP